MIACHSSFCGMSDKSLYSLSTLNAFDAFADFLDFVECGDCCYKCYSLKGEMDKEVFMAVMAVAMVFHICYVFRVVIF